MIFPESDLSQPMKKLLHFVEKIFGIYRWHPTIALRYIPIVDFINYQKLQNAEVLEVGSGGLGITPYIGRRVVGLDIDFTEPIHENLIPVKGTSIEIPFADNSFPVVVSTDMLEHLSKKNRTEAIFEMLRIARKVLCLGVPCGKEAQSQDENLSRIYKSIYHQEFDFFTEHSLHGLPEKAEIIALLHRSARKMGKSIHISSHGTLNLKVRLWLMHGWMSQNVLVNLIFRKGLLFAIPLMGHMNKSPTYRQMFFVTLS